MKKRNKCHQKQIEELQRSYPTLSILDLYYLSMKCYGIQDRIWNEGRPSLNLIDDSNMYHITFATDEAASPYHLEGEELTHEGQALPFRTVYVERIPVRVRRYYYMRNSRYLTPTLNDELILNLNFQHTCYQCGFCQNLICGSQANVTPEEGFNLIMSRGDFSTLEHVDEIAIVTGLFGSGERALRNVIEVIQQATKYGFHGRLYYMGFELADPKPIKQLLDAIDNYGLADLKITYTIEMFSDRQRLMQGHKGKGEIAEMADKLLQIRQAGVNNLQYSYIPGLDNLDEFKRGAELLAPLAEPHLSIYRQFKPEQRQKHISQDFAAMGPAYLCEMRIFYEQLYGYQLIGNNLGNMFAFPLNRISQCWTEGEIVGDVSWMRYWRNDRRPEGWRVIH